jgi:Na+-transporting methylmalonyl-CoA/oxaloacetate decarboxylase gamma subunit
MLRSFAVLSFLAFLVACAGAPVQEMSDARQAIQAARAAGAPTRAPDDFSAAQAAIQRAESHLQQHEYSSAKMAAIEAKHDASVALAQAQRAGGADPSH